MKHTAEYENDIRTYIINNQSHTSSENVRELQQQQQQTKSAWMYIQNDCGVCVVVTLC
jgi:hypothetical protein